MEVLKGFFLFVFRRINLKAAFCNHKPGCLRFLLYYYTTICGVFVILGTNEGGMTS